MIHVSRLVGQGMCFMLGLLLEPSCDIRGAFSTAAMPRVPHSNAKMALIKIQYDFKSGSNLRIFNAKMSINS